MNPNEVDFITSLYDSEDGYASPYSATIDEDSDSSASEDCESASSGEEAEEVDPFMYCSARYFAFTRGTYDLMLKDLSGQVKVTFDTLSAVARGAPLNLHAWRRMKSRLTLRNENTIYLKASPHLQVTNVEKWREIVLASHCGASHRSLTGTLTELKRLWSNDLRDHGIPSAYVKAVVDRCGCQVVSRLTPSDMEGTSVVKYKKSRPIEVIKIEAHKLDDTLIDVQLRYHTRFRTGATRGACVTRYNCHRSGVANKKYPCTRRRKHSSRCGCTFHVNARRNDGVDHGTMTLSIYGPHTGHVPGSRPDAYYLPAHPNVISCCRDDLFYVGCARHVARMSMRKEAYHKSKASPLDLVTYRFFMIPKEVHNMANKLKIGSAMSAVDWSLMMQDAYALRDLGKVAHVQPYLPGEYGSPARQPFILVLQDEWMLEMCERLSINNSWAIDSTFKTNQFGLPLYAAVAPNAMGVGIPLWYMICSSDKGSNHEQVALETCLRVIFARMPNVRPNAIVIDKSWTSYNAISNVVATDRLSWIVTNGQRSQTHCRLLLCQFHAKKAWLDNLLPKVSATERNHLYNQMCQLMQCITESTFSAQCEELKVEYANKPGVWQYIEGGWCGLTCVWRKLWPKFGRMFNYGHVDTTNIVERHWQFIKYTALRGRINRSITDLVHVLIGDSQTGTCVGGTVIEWYKQRQEICESGRFAPRANCRDQTTRLKEAERLLERYETNDATMHTVDEPRYWFKILSLTKPNVWYNVSLQCSYCDCQDPTSKCKHILGIRMIIERHMPHLCGSLPFIDHASHMRNDHFTETEVETEVEPVEETNPITSQMEEWESKLQTAEGAIQSLRQGLRSLDRATILACMESIEEMSHAVVYRVGAPKPTNEEDRGSIRRKQAIGAKRGASVNISQDLIGSSPNTSKAHTGKMQRGASRARRRLPICATEKIRCLHCDALTFRSRDSNVDCCKNCGRILPSSPDEP